MSGSATEVAKARFKKAFGFGVADVLVDRSLDNARKEVGALRTQAARLLSAGLSSAQLTNTIARLEQGIQAGLQQVGNQAQQQALERVSDAASTYTANAKRWVDESLVRWEKLRPALKPKMDEARIAANAADDEIGNIQPRQFQTKLRIALATVQTNRISLTNNPDAARLQTLAGDLGNCERQAKRIEVAAKDAKTVVDEWAKQLAELDNAIAALPPTLTETIALGKRRDALANADLDQLKAELGNAPKLLADIEAAAKQWSQLQAERTAKLVELDNSLEPLQLWLNDSVDGPLGGYAKNLLITLTQERAELENASPEKLAETLGKAAALLARLRADHAVAGAGRVPAQGDGRETPLQPQGEPSAGQFLKAIATETAKASQALADIETLRLQTEKLRASIASDPAFILPKGAARHDRSTIRAVVNKPPDASDTPRDTLAEPERKKLLDSHFAEKTALSREMDELGEEWSEPLGRLHAAVKGLQALATLIVVAREPASPDNRAFDGVAKEQAAASLATANQFDDALAELSRLKEAFQRELQDRSDYFLKDFAARFQHRDPDAEPGSLKSVHEAEDKTYKAASLGYQAEVQADKNFTTAAAPGTASTLQPFDVGALLTNDMYRKLRSRDTPSPDIDNIAQTLADSVATAFRNLPPGSDQLFDLGLKGSRDFKAAIAAKLGWVYSVDNEMEGQPTERWSPNWAGRVGDRIADRMYRQVRESSPDKISDDQTAMTFNGKVYAKEKQLGAGAQNIADRYKASDGTTVVVRKAKNIIDGEDFRAARAAQVEDIVKHRMAAKFNGEGAENVLKLLGTQATDRDVFGIFEDCEGGDAETFAQGVHAAAETGLLPSTVRNAMTREMFGQVAKGMKCLSDHGLAHNDFKPPNVFLTADGTMKVADLGEVSPVDAQGGSPTGTPGSPGYQAASTDKPSLQRDIGMMGTFLDILSGDIGGDALNINRRRPGGAGALQRVRDAMLDPDPAKRPTVDAVLRSAYVTQPPEQAELDLTDVKKAMISYSKQVAKQIAGPLGEISKARHAMNESWRSDYKNGQEYERHMATVKEQNAIIEQQLKLIAQINNQQEVTPFVEQVQKAVATVRKEMGS